MTVKELRYLVDNLDEYIHVPSGIERLKKTVLHLAVSGQLVPQDPSEGTGDELYQQIQAQKAKLIASGKLKKQKPLPAINEEDIPFAIPKTWKWVRLGDVIILKSGADLKPNQYNGHNDGVPYITGASNIANGQVIINRWTPEPKNIAVRGSLLLTCKGTIGAMAFLHEDKAHIARQLMAIRFTRLQNPGFIKIIIETKLRTLQAVAQSIIPGIAREDVLGIIVALPPLIEQKRIVEKVDAIFALIDELAEKYRTEQAEREKLVASSLAQLARGNGDLALMHLSEIIRTKADAAKLRKAILHLAVSGQLVPQDPSEGTGEELYQQIQAEKAKLIAEGKLKKQKPLPEITEAEIPFAIPKTWKWVRIGDLCQIENGNAFKSSEYTDRGLRIIRITNVQSGYIVDYDPKFIDNTRLDEFRKYELAEGDMLMSLTGHVGRAALITSEFLPALLNQRVAKLIWSTAINKQYVIQYLSSNSFANAASVSARGAAQPNMSTEWLKSYVIPIPPLAEQTRIVQKATQLLDLIAKLEPHLGK